MRSPHATPDAVPVAGDAERPLPDAQGKSQGAPRGNGNARKHGLYTVKAIAERRNFAALMRAMKRNVEESNG